MNELDKPIEDFLFHCQYERNLSRKTIKASRIDLTQAKKFVNSNFGDLKISEIDKAILRSYLKSLFQQYRPRTIKRKIASLKALFNFLEFEDVIDINPFRKMKIRIKEGKRLPRTIELSQIRKLFQYLYSLKSMHRGVNSSHYKIIVRDIAVLELLFSTGLRVSELSNLKRTDLDFANGFVRIFGKGERERLVPICNAEALSSLREYTALVEKYVEEAEHLFLNRLNSRLSEQSIRFMLKKRAKEIHIQEKITPHMFRHSIATLLIERGADIQSIQYLLGHSSITTTQIYTHVSDSVQRRLLIEKHPRKSFDVPVESAISCNKG